MSRTFAVVLRQYYLMRGSFTRLVPLFVWVAIDMLMWGFITRYLTQFTEPGFHLTQILLGAALMWNFFTRVMMGVTLAFFEDVWSRNFLNMFASPLTITEYVSGLVLTSIFTSSVGLLAILFIAVVVFGLPFFSLGLVIIPYLFVLFLFGIALGIIGCAIVLRFGPASEWFVWPIPAIISPFVGVFYPLATLPDWMQWIAHVLPPSYVFENMRALVAGGVVDHSQLLWGIGLALIYILLAGWVFTRVYRSAVRTGLIARYSAESVS